MRDHSELIIHKALRAVRPQFRLNFADGIHGVPHWSRVWFHGRALATALDINPQVLAWFAFLHDSQRHNDGHDPQHGRRAADFAIRLRRDRVINELAPHEFGHLCEAMRLHSDGHTTAEPAIVACWDADRLDLARVGKRPHPGRLCTAYARTEANIEEAVLLSTGMRRTMKRTTSCRPGRTVPFFCTAAVIECSACQGIDGRINFAVSASAININDAPSAEPGSPSCSFTAPATELRSIVEWT